MFLVKFYSNIATGLVLILLTALFSLLGIFIPQGMPVEHYKELFKSPLSDIILFCGMNRMYYSWLFIAILSNLGLSLTICTARRIPAILKILQMSAVPSGIKPDPREIPSNRPVEETKSMIMNLMKKRWLKPTISAEGKTIIVSVRENTWSLFSSIGFHLAMIIILLGTLIGSIAGFQTMLRVIEGETVRIPGTDVRLILDRFVAEFQTAAMIPKSYTSYVRYWKTDGTEVVQAISMNHPLKVNGVQLSQSGYGASDTVRDVTITMRDTATRRESSIIVAKGEKFSLPGGIEAVVEKYFSDLTLNAFGKPTNASREHKAPAVMILLKKDGSEARGLLRLSETAMMPIPGTPIQLRFIGAHPAFYSDLRAIRDPGRGIVFLGFLLLTVGISLLYLFTFSLRSIMISPMAGGTSVVRVVSYIRRDVPGHASRLDRLIQALKIRFNQEESK